MTHISFGKAENGNLSMSFVVEVPQTESIMFSDKEASEARNNKRAIACDIIGAFSERLIASLERRMSACQKKLLAHIENAKAIDGNFITWRRKDGSEDHFIVGSFEAMKDAIKMLHSGAQWKFLQNRTAVDQTIKALLNDTEQDHSDANGFRYSELVSVLMESHIFVLE